MKNRLMLAGGLGVALLLAACGGNKEGATATSGDSSAASAPAAAGAPATPAPGGQVITVEAISDSSGNYFKPAEITARQGDVVRFTLKIGVHNVDFLPDSNKGAVGLPAKPSDLLQLPGQTYDVPVTMKPGKYYFQCDPHAALGMKGHLTVQ